jgi:hypothetical protein
MFLSNCFCCKQINYITSKKMQMKYKGLTRLALDHDAIFPAAMTTQPAEPVSNRFT